MAAIEMSRKQRLHAGCEQRSYDALEVGTAGWVDAKKLAESTDNSLITRSAWRALTVTASVARISVDEGSLMSIVYHRARDNSEIVLLGAKNRDKEIAVSKLDHHVPFGFYGKVYQQTFV